MPDAVARLSDAIFELDEDGALEAAREALASGVTARELVEGGIRPALARIGTDFEQGTKFLPELVIAGDIASQVADMVDEALPAGGVETRGSIALGTVKGDIHSVGKNIVSLMMRASGLRVLDLGTDVSAAEFLRVAPDVDAIGLSGLLTTVSRNMKEIIAAVREQYPESIIITGGACMNQELAGALDVLYGPDAASGTQMLVARLADRERVG
jgi:5-methyltetrahydrofolate--homocysteine methyltransferase